MAMNMLQENEYISCPKCKGKLFTAFEHYTLKRVNTSSGVKLQIDTIKTKYVCVQCNEDITNQIKQYEIL